MRIVTILSRILARTKRIEGELAAFAGQGRPTPIKRTKKGNAIILPTLASPKFLEESIDLLSSCATEALKAMKERVVPALLTVIRQVAWRSWEMQLVLTQTPHVGLVHKEENRMLMSHRIGHTMASHQFASHDTVTSPPVLYREPLNRTKLTMLPASVSYLTETNAQVGRTVMAWCLYRKENGTITPYSGTRTSVIASISYDISATDTLLRFLLDEVCKRINQHYTAFFNDESSQQEEKKHHASDEVIASNPSSISPILAALRDENQPSKEAPSSAQSPSWHFLRILTEDRTLSDSSSTPEVIALTPQGDQQVIQHPPTLPQSSDICPFALAIRSILRDNILILDGLAIVDSTYRSTNTSFTGHSLSQSSVASRRKLPFTQNEDTSTTSTTSISTDTTTTLHHPPFQPAPMSIHELPPDDPSTPRCSLHPTINPVVTCLRVAPELVHLGIPTLTDLFVAFSLANGRGGPSFSHPFLLKALRIAVSNEENKRADTSLPASRDQAIMVSSLYRLARYVCTDNEEAAKALRLSGTLDLSPLLDRLREVLFPSNARGSATAQPDHASLQVARNISALIEVLWMTTFPPCMTSGEAASIISALESSVSPSPSHGEATSTPGTECKTGGRGASGGNVSPTRTTRTTRMRSIRQWVSGGTIFPGCQGVVTFSLPSSSVSPSPSQVNTAVPNKAKQPNALTPETPPRSNSRLIAQLTPLRALPSSQKSFNTPFINTNQLATPGTALTDRTSTASSNPRHRGSITTGASTPRCLPAYVSPEDLSALSHTTIQATYTFCIDYLLGIIQGTLINPLLPAGHAIRASHGADVSNTLARATMGSRAVSSTSSSTAPTPPSLSLPPRQPLIQNDDNRSMTESSQTFSSLIFTSQMRWLEVLLPYLVECTPVKASNSPGSSQRGLSSPPIMPNAKLSIPSDKNTSEFDPLTEVARLIFIILRRVADSPLHYIACNTYATSSEMNHRRCEAMAAGCRLLGLYLRAIQVRATEVCLKLQVIQLGAKGAGGDSPRASIDQNPSSDRLSPSKLSITIPPQTDSSFNLTQDRQSGTSQTRLIPSLAASYNYIVSSDESIGQTDDTHELARVLLKLFHYNSSQLRNAIASLLSQIREASLPNLLVLAVSKSSSLRLDAYTEVLWLLGACVSRASYENAVLHGTTGELKRLAKAFQALLKGLHSITGSISGNASPKDNASPKETLHRSVTSIYNSLNMSTEDVTLPRILQGILNSLGLPQVLKVSLTHLVQRLDSSESQGRELDVKGWAGDALVLLRIIPELYLFMSSRDGDSIKSADVKDIATNLVAALGHLKCVKSEGRVQSIEVDRCIMNISALVSDAMCPELLEALQEASSTLIADLYVQTPYQHYLAILLCRMLSLTATSKRANKHHHTIISCISQGISSVISKLISSPEVKPKASTTTAPAIPIPDTMDDAAHLPSSLPNPDFNIEDIHEGMTLSFFAQHAVPLQGIDVLFPLVDDCNDNKLQTLGSESGSQDRTVCILFDDQDALLALHLLASCSPSDQSGVAKDVLALPSIEHALLSNSLPINAEFVLLHYLVNVYLSMVSWCSHFFYISPLTVLLLHTPHSTFIPAFVSSYLIAQDI